MLGLPDHVTTCLFDLDGVLTEDGRRPRRGVEARRSTRSSTVATGQAPFDAGPRLHRATSTASPAWTACASFLAVARDHAAGGHAGRPARRRDRQRARRPQERPRQRGPRAAGRRGRTTGRCATSRAARDAGLRPRRRVLEQPTPRRCCVAAGIARPVRGRGRRRRRRARGACAASPRPTRSSPARGRLGVEPAQAAVFEDALAGVEAGRAGAFGCVVGVDRARAADALREHGADIVVDDLAELLESDDRGPRFRVEPWAISETGLDLDDLGADASRSSRCPTGTSGCAATSTRASRTTCPARTSTGSSRPARCPTPRPATATRRTARRSSTSPTASSSACSSTTSRSTCATASSISHERVLDLRDGVLRREVEWRSPAGQRVRVRSTRLVSFTHRAVAAIRYEVEPVGTPARIVVQSELVANEPVPEQRGDPRAAAALAAPLVGRAARAPRAARGAAAPARARAGCGSAAAMDHVVDGPAGHAHRRRERARPRPAHDHDASSQPGEQLRIMKFLAYGWSSRRSTPALRDQVEAALASALPHRLGRAARRPARVPRRLLGGRRHRDRRRPGAAAGGALRALPRAAGRRARRGAGDPGQGPHRPRLRRPHLLGHGDRSSCRC